MLTDKVSLITGASSGIGEATALALAKAGSQVVLAARRADRLKAIKSRIEAEGGKALIVVTDVTSKKEVKNAVDQAVEHFGRINILINNAGIMPLAFMRNLRVEEWDRTIDVNIKGVLNGIAAALPVFRQQKSGHFVNIASVGGRRLYAGATVYCATKFAVRAISEGLRMELDPVERIKVTVIEPGAVKTELPNSITDSEYRDIFKTFASSITFLEPEDIAQSILYAVSQAERVNVDEILIMPREQGH